VTTRTDSYGNSVILGPSHSVNNIIIFLGLNNKSRVHVMLLLVRCGGILLVEILIVLLSEGGTIAGVLHPLEVFDFEHDDEMCLAPCVVGLDHKERSGLLNYKALNIRRD
jgi:hypothetical protein